MYHSSGIASCTVCIWDPIHILFRKEAATRYNSNTKKRNKKETLKYDFYVRLIPQQAVKWSSKNNARFLFNGAGEGGRHTCIITITSINKLVITFPSSSTTFHHLHSYTLVNLCKDNVAAFNLKEICESKCLGKSDGA
jgi:hypothetical protein